MQPRICLPILLVVACCVRAPAALAANVGFQVVDIPAGTQPPIHVGIWYPTNTQVAAHELGGWTQMVAENAPAAPGPFPLVVMSHGNGGWFGGHYDTALALAHAGFVAAALTHPGDNFRDQSHAADMPARPRSLHALIDYMVTSWPFHAAVDPARIGAFGFSSGGFTVLAAIGGVPDFSRFAAHCHDHPAYFDCALAARAGVPLNTASIFPPSVWVHDPSIKSAVVAAPALGFTFVPDGLKTVTIPIQLWRAEDDRVLPTPDYAEAVRLALPNPPDYHVVPHAGHFDFLAPCDPGLAAEVPIICTSEPTFNRAAFHTMFDSDVASFFLRTLKPVP